MCSTDNNLYEVNALLTTRKRSRSEAESSDNEAAKRSCYGLRKLLDYKYSGVSSDGEASVLSLQNHETDEPHDTPFDESSSEYDSSDVVEIEYECVSDSEHGSFLTDISTGSEETLAVGAIAAVLCDSSLEPWFTDREDSDNSSEEGELEGTKWRLCIQCKEENNNPFYRYCQECFQKRKELFPPRPKGFKKRDELEEKLRKKLKAKTCSQDSGIGSFDSDILERKTEPSRLKRKRTSISTAEDEFEFENEYPKKLKPDPSVISYNNNLLDSVAEENWHEVPILKIHSEKDSSETHTKLNDSNKVVETIANVSGTITKNKSNWIKKTVIINDNETECSTLNENCEFNAAQVTKELCMMCASENKNSIFLHGTTGHLACCYQCSLKTWKTTKCCPVCKAKVRNIVKIYT